MRKLIFGVSAPCGAGKTHSAVRFIKDNTYRQNFLYVAPSRKLIQETASQLKKLGISPKIITSDTHLNNVISSIVSYLKDAMDHGHVLLITWNAYERLPYFNKRENWRIVIDEIPRVDDFYRLRVPHNTRFLSDFLEIERCVNESVGIIRAKDEGKLHRFLEQPNDDVHDVFYPLFKDVLSANCDVFVDLASWERVADRGKVSEDDETNTIFFLSLLNPTLFSGAILLGANLDRSLLANWLTRYHGMAFVEHKGTKAGLRSQDASVGNRIQISYFLEN